MPATVDHLLQKSEWHAERQRLHAILLDCGLSVSVKWGKLCYALDGANVAIIFGMKDSCAVGFFKGALLDDPDVVLVAPGEHSQAMRRIHFTSLEGVEASEGTIRDYAARAIEVEKQGLQIEPQGSKTPEYPPELEESFTADPQLKRAFEQLTPGRQRGYLIHFTSRANPETRRRRIEKSAPGILARKGMHDR